MIPCQELNAKRQIRVESSYESIMYQNKILNHISTKLPKVPLRPWAENWIHLSHKRTLWIEEPKSKNSERKACRRTHMKRTKVQKHKRCKMAWEWGTNEYLCLPYATILWCPSWQLPEDKGNKWNSSFWPQKSYLDLKILVSTLLNWTIIND